MNFLIRRDGLPLGESTAMKIRAFTLAEVMVAILFVSIAIFGYIALHMRIIHSSTSLHQRHAIRRKVDLHSGLLVGVARQGKLPADGVYPLFLDTATQEFLTPYLVYAGDNPDNQYSGQERIQSVASIPGMKRLSVEINWSNRHGDQQYVVDTYVGAGDKGW